MHNEISWIDVQNLFNKVQSVSVGTVDTDGMPRVSPIGSVFLTDENRGYYFERFPQAMRDNLDRDPQMCLMAVNPGGGFWIKSLCKGRFTSQPALRLFCRTWERRAASESEIEAWMNKVKPFRFFKGHDLLWKDMSMVRDFEVLRVESVELGRMNP